MGGPTGWKGLFLSVCPFVLCRLGNPHRDRSYSQLSLGFYLIIAISFWFYPGELVHTDRSRVTDRCRISEIGSNLASGLDVCVPP